MLALFSLIKALTPTEKRYFKLFAQRQVQYKKTAYYKIYEIINKQSIYSEEDLVKKLKPKHTKNQLSVAKNYLFNMILKSMQEFNEDNYIEWRLRNNFLQIKLLASKGLDTQVEKQIKKLKAQLWQHEFYHMILDVIALEKYLNGNKRIGEYSLEHFTEIEQEEIKALDIINTHKNLTNIWHKLTLLDMKSNQLSKAEVTKIPNKLVSDNCMLNEPKISYNSKFRYHSTWSLYYQVTHQQEKNNTCCLQAIYVKEEQLKKQPLLGLDALASYYNYLVSCDKANIWTYYSTYLQKTHLSR